jgi:ABC-type glycerol-3-phosphate transport system substrate-binding protein
VPEVDSSGGGAPLSRRRFLELAGLVVPVGAALAACGGSGGPSGGSKGGAFPIGAAAAASQKPVKITLWHSMSSRT